MTQTYTSAFGGQTVPPSDYQFRAFNLTANLTLYWPENTDGTDLVASLMNVTPNGGAWTVTLPAANQVSSGRDFIMRNLGAVSFDVVDNAAGAVVTIAAGEARYFYLTDNSTAAGTWSVVTYGTGTSSADASALEGYGLTTLSGTLNSDLPIVAYGAGITVSATDRASFLVYQGGTSTWFLPDPTTLPNGFYCAVNNSGTGTLTLDANTAGGTIDESNTKMIQPGESCFIVSKGDVTGYFTIGYGRSTEFAFTQLSVDVSGVGGITITSAQAANKLWYFYNTAGADRTVTIPAVASVYFIRVGAIGAGNDLTFTTGGGATVILSANQSYTIYCDGTNVTSAQTVAVTSTVALDDGSAASPSFNFTLDTDTGLYRANTNLLGVTAAGTMVATFGTTGLTLATDLAVTEGGTGVSTLTGIVKGNGTSAFSAASAGTDYVAPGGALGTPSSGTLTNCTGLPVATGISGLGANVATMLATPTKANFDSALSDDNFAYLGTVQTFTKAQLIQPDSDVAGLTVRGGAGGTANALQVQTVASTPLFTVTGDGHLVAEGVTSTGATGTGKFVFDTSPTLVTPLLGTPTSGTLTNCTGLPLTTGVTGTLGIANGGTGQTTQTDAFDALAPTTTKGDLIGHNGTDNVRFGVGTNGYVLSADSTAAPGVAWKSAVSLGVLTLPVSIANGGTAKTTISAKSVWVANSADTLVEVTPAAGQSIRINAGDTAWEAFTPSTGDFKADGTVSMTGNLQMNAGLGVTFEGTTADAFETTLVAGEPTADRTVTLPNETTTLAGLAVAQSFTAKQTFAADTFRYTDGAGAGKVFTSDAEGDGSWQTAAAGGSMIYLSTVTASNSATVDIETTLDSTYDAYVIVATNVSVSTTAQILCRMKLGGAYATTTYRYHTARPNSSAATYDGFASDSATSIIISQSIDDTAVGEFTMSVKSPTSAVKKLLHWIGSFLQTSTTFIGVTSGAATNDSTSSLTGIRFYASTGNVATGTFRLYGIKNS